MRPIEEQLQAIDDELAELEHRKQALLTRKAQLHKENRLLAIQAQEKLSAAERINLFKALFCGRNDVFALKWENQNT